MLQKREEEIAELEAQLNATRIEFDKMERDNGLLRTANAKLEKAVREENREVERKFEDYERKVRETEQKQNDARREVERQLEQATREKETLEEKTRQVESELFEANAKLNMYMRDYEENRRLKEFMTRL